MYFKILFTWKVKNRINNYAYNYSNYYKKLFEDSFIWSEDEIIRKYEEDADLRVKEIYQKIISKLQDNLIVYPDNIVLIKWRSKYLIVTFYDENDNRIISDLEIR